MVNNDSIQHLDPELKELLFTYLKTTSNQHQICRKRTLMQPPVGVGATRNTVELAPARKTL